MCEYKVLTPYQYENLEESLNGLAKDGWDLFMLQGANLILRKAKYVPHENIRAVTASEEQALMRKDRDFHPYAIYPFSPISAITQPPTDPSGTLTAEAARRGFI